MTSPSVRTVLPLAAITATGMLAMDLFLPAVPTLQAALATGVSQAQATVSLFLIGLAASQLLWGEVMSRMGPRRCVLLGVSALAATSFGCALAPDIRWLLALRFLQGMAAGAAGVVAPAVVRATLSDHDVVRGMAGIAMIESIVPAAGPVLGAALLGMVDWRGTFWVVGAIALLLLPAVLRITPRQLPGLDGCARKRLKAGYRDILKQRKFLRLMVANALCFSTLMTFVASAPQLMVHALGLGAPAFAALQVIGVAGFMVGASQSGRISHRIGPARAIHAGAWAHVALCALFVAVALRPLEFGAVAAFWCAFCFTLAVRGPATFSEALALPTAQMGRASALMMLAMLVAAGLGTQAVAPFMDTGSALPLAGTMLALSLASVAAVTPYPQPASAAGGASA